MRTLMLILITVAMTACGNPTAPQDKVQKVCADPVWVPSAPDGWVRPLVMCGKI